MQYILLLEDDDVFREIIADLLSSEGYVVVEADSAQKAIELAHSRPFQLVLSDVRMAGSMDGVGAIEAIQVAVPGIRSIVMTGFADLDVPLRAARLRADDYLTKPFDMRELLRVVRSVLQRREALPPGVLSRLVDSAGKAGRWFFDRQIQEVNTKRSEFYQPFFLLIRSNRISAEEAYPVFLALEQVEVAGMKSSVAPSKQLLAYEDLQKQLMAALSGGRTVAATGGVGWKEFRRLYQRLQSGKVDSTHFQNALQLLHLSELRKSDLQSYATYCWLWEDEPQEEAVDPFLGLQFGIFTLDTRLLGVGQARLYSLSRGGSPCPERILCIPVEQPPSLFQEELASGRADYLKEAYRHHFLFYPGDPGVTSLARLVPAGTAWSETWSLMRPFFERLAEYHEAGLCSGCFASSQVRFGGDGTVTIHDFGPTWFQRTHLYLTTPNQCPPTQMQFLLCSAPEALTREQPSPRSDQFVAGRVLLEALNIPSPELKLLDESAGDELWEMVNSIVGIAVGDQLRRLCHPQPGARFPDMRQAMLALDQVDSAPA